MTIQLEMEKAKIEEKKHQKRNWRKLFWIGIMTVPVITFSTIMVLEPAIVQKHKPTDHLAREVQINPEIKILTEYQKKRNSRIPIEIAELQAVMMIRIAKEEKLPIELIVGIAEKESNFDSYSISSAGATGLMQILQAPNVDIDQDQRYNIKYNLEIACLILHGKLEKNQGNLTQALADYSGNAEGYAGKVYESIGRYSMFKAREKESGIAIVRN